MNSKKICIFPVCRNVMTEEGINKVSWKLELVKPTTYILVRA